MHRLPELRVTFVQLPRHNDEPMKESIPFFYYDILSKLIPGGLTIAVLGIIGLKVPGPWSALLAKQEPWMVVVLPLVLASSAYGFGGLLDAIFRLKFAEGFGEKHYFASRKKYNRPDLLPSNAGQENFHYDAWQWLALIAAQENPSAFSLAHRFQAEARLYALSAAPAAIIAGWAISQWSVLQFLRGWKFGLAALAAIAIFRLCVVAAENCEERRWIWTLAALAQLRSKWPARWESAGAASV